MNSDKTLIKALLDAEKHHNLADSASDRQDDRDDGTDADWPRQYAQYLLEHTDFQSKTKRQWQTDELAQALADLQTSYARKTRRHHWAHYFSQRLSE